ncbi:hypothetical protein HYW41_02660 [Candidatus Daviesbacteria bacterium]|nr:hypothetical protein [Candidatus Daviesbacteria bacterium]
MIVERERSSVASVVCQRIERKIGGGITRVSVDVRGLLNPKTGFVADIWIGGPVPNPLIPGQRADPTPGGGQN